MTATRILVIGAAGFLGSHHVRTREPTDLLSVGRPAARPAGRLRGR